MKDLKSRFAILIYAAAILPSLFVMMGCQGLVADPHHTASQPSLVLGTSTITWSNIVAGSSETLTDTLSNPGGGTITINSASISGGDFQIVSPSLPVTLAAGQTANLSISFNPANPGTENATVSISSSALNGTLTLNLTGTAVAGGQLVVSPSSLSFGNVNVGSSQTVSGTMKNSGSSSLTITQALISGGDFALSGITTPLTLSANQSVPFSVKFQPSQSGAQNGTLSLAGTVSLAGSSKRTFNSRLRAHDTTALSMSVPLTGTGMAAGQLAASPGNLTFPSIQSGKTEALTETLTNSTGASVTISKAAVTGTGFSLTAPALPLTLAANQSASLSVTYAPQTTGAATGALAITSTAPNSSLSFTLSATATATPTGALTAKTASLNFGSVQTGSSQSLSETVTNSGNASVTISSAAASGTGYSMTGLTAPLTLTAGQTVTLTVTLAPTTAGSSSGNIAITSNASNATLNIPLSATVVAPGSISATPATVSFGSVQTGTTQLISETLKNPGGTSVTVSQANITGSAFTISGLTLPLTLAAGQSFTFGINFAPQTTGAASGSLLITSNASVANLTLSLSGTGTSVGQLAVTPASLSFGSVTVDNSQTLTATLTATGGSVTINSLTPSTSEFAISGITLPVTIASGKTATFTVAFTPQSSGAATANISIASNASNPTLTEGLAGTGSAAVQHTVNLAWIASTSTVTGYNVYRGTVSGGPYSKINSSVDGATTYADSTVTNGQTYFYVTTAVDGSGNESSDSNQVSAAIPAN